MRTRRVEVARLGEAVARRRASPSTKSSALERLEHGLRLAEVAIENTTEGVMITDARLRILAVNRAFFRITGYSEAEVLERQPSLLQSGRHDGEFYEAMWGSIRSQGHWQGEIWNRRKGGADYPASLSIRAVPDARGDVVNYVGVFSDLTAIRESEARCDFLAHHDPLTGLPNKLLFVARGERALARARFSGGRVAVVFLELDLDRFKHLDNTLGQPAGDELLRRVGERLDQSVRAEDVVGRLDGNRFMILLKELADGDSAGVVARRLLDGLAVPFRLSGFELYATAAIGVSLFPQDGDELDVLMEAAASAMDYAREQARGSVQFYSAELTRAKTDRFRMESELRRAIHSDELVLHFQPQVSVWSGRIVGVEALVRWRHPELGLILPSRFLPLAESTGLVVEIGAWVLGEACRQVCRWMAEGLPALRVAVNLSAQEISATPLADVIAATLAETGLDPAQLEVEITEASVMANLERAVVTLCAVKSLGVTIALDDFGTGHSSLNYLRRFPIDRLKLDGSFICQVADLETDRAVAHAAIELGHAFKLGVVAEGVETPGQLRFLSASGCDTYQGHLFAAALPPDGLASILRAEGGREGGAVRPSPAAPAQASWAVGSTSAGLIARARAIATRC